LPGPDDLLLECINDLFQLLESQVEADAVTGQVAVPDLLQGLGWVVLGMTSHLGWHFLLRFWNLVIPFSLTELDPSSKNDREYGDQLFSSVMSAFSAIVSAAASFAQRESRALSKDEDFVRMVKGTVFPLFKRIWTLGCLTNRVGRHVVDLCDVLATTLGNRVNVPIHGLAVNRILNWANSGSTDKKLREDSHRMLGLIKEL
jgi:hypothetical protein